MPPQPVFLRKAEIEDIDVLVDLNRCVHDLHVAAQPSYFKQPERHAVAALFRTRLERSEVQVSIANVGHIASGYIVSVLRERQENALCFARRVVEIEEVAVAPEHRLCGVARALVEHVLAQACEQGVSELELNSWAFNTGAHAAFEALGFRPMMVRFARQVSQ
jgi:ribosomal protein S18 acetylase RimI-like enzyme